jgi:phosphoglycolate phosphatase-like HAD superfamily hydrolase
VGGAGGAGGGVSYVTAEQPSKFKTGEGKPVVALDIDGTLGDYHAHFLWFASVWLGRDMPSALDVNPGMRLSEFMGVPHSVYRECKLAYRQGGLKRFMPVYPFASKLTDEIHNLGADIWLCTTRPYLRLDNIDPDTREWLRRNGIQYDAVIFGGLEDEPNKYPELVRQVGADRIVAAVDDLPEQVNMAMVAGIRTVYVRDQPYNRDLNLANFSRVLSLEELWYSYLQYDIGEWWAHHG